MWGQEPALDPLAAPSLSGPAGDLQTSMRKGAAALRNAVQGMSGSEIRQFSAQSSGASLFLGPAPAVMAGTGAEATTEAATGAGADADIAVVQDSPPEEKDAHGGGGCIV